MGNDNDKLNKESKKLKKLRSEAIKNNKQIIKAFQDNEEDEISDLEENEIDEEKEKQINEYDKEISKMLFDEEAELDEGERLKNLRKKDKKSELKSYAEQIAEEQFMEEINRSKSVNRVPRRKNNDSDEDSEDDSDDYESFKKWRERKKKNKKKNGQNKKNNIKKVIDDEDENESDDNNKKAKYKKKRNKSSGKNQRNLSNENNQRNIKTENFNYNDQDGNLNINEELGKNKTEKKKEKPKNKTFAKSTNDEIFSFGNINTNIQDNNNYHRYNSNPIPSNPKPSNQVESTETGYSFNANQQEPQMNYTPINNNIHQNYNPTGPSSMGYSPSANYPQSYNQNNSGYNQFYPGSNNNMNPINGNMSSIPLTGNMSTPSTPTISGNMSTTPVSGNISTNPLSGNMSTPSAPPVSGNMSTTPVSGNISTNPLSGNMSTTPLEQNDMNSFPSTLEETDPGQVPPQKKSFFSFFKKKQQISKKVYAKIKPEDLRIVLLYMKNSNNKYQEGLDYCGRRKYNEALTSFAQARASYTALNKLMNANPKAYPTEFRMVISQKINEKLSLVHQSIRECNGFLKNNYTGQIEKNPEKAEDILRNINNLNNNNLNNFNNNMNSNNNNINNNSNNNQNKQKSIHDKEEDEMDDKIESEIMMKNPGVKFDDIIGMKEMKRILYEIIVVPTIRPDLFTGIRKPQRGILLFGPPGTGKTMIAKAIASECNSTFFNISASSLTSKWVGESEKTVKSLFKLAYKKVPSIIFIDEIDSILSKRSESENEATKRLKTEFLIQFDGLGSNTNARLLVIAATNRPMDLDEALLRRLPKRVYCGPLDEEGRFEFIKKVINRVETNLSDRDIKEIARMTNGYSNSDLKELCKEAAYQPVRELTMEQILRIQKFRPLVKNDLVKSVQKIRGTLSHKVINELLEWNEQFGGV